MFYIIPAPHKKTGELSYPVIRWAPMKNIYLFHGKDSYTSSKKALHWRKEFEKKYGDLNTEILEGKDLTVGQYTETVSTLPFLSEKKFVTIMDAFAHTPTEELKLIAEKLEATPDHCVVVFIERGEADRRTSLFKTITKIGRVMEFNSPDEYALINWITAETKKKGGLISPGNARLLAQMVGPDLWQMESEIEKLAVHADGREITAEDIRNLASPNIETTIFVLTDNLGAKNRRETIRTLKTLIDSGVNLIPLLFTVVSHFRTLIQVKECLAKNMNPETIIKKLKKHPFTVKKAISQCKNFTAENLEQIYRKLLETDIAQKTGKIKMTTEDQSELRLSLERIFLTSGR